MISATPTFMALDLFCFLALTVLYTMWAFFVLFFVFFHEARRYPRERRENGEGGEKRAQVKYSSIFGIRLSRFVACETKSYVRKAMLIKEIIQTAIAK